MGLTTVLALLSGVLLASPKIAECACDNAVTRQCGHPMVQPSSARIVGGQEAQIGSWPWIVALAEDDFAVCAGAIINDRIILTAAHCFEDTLSRNASRWRVAAGKHHLLKNDRGEAHLNVESIIMHDHFVHDTVENDIAIVVVRETIPFTNFIRPICLPSGTAQTALHEGKACLMAGWGNTKDTGSSEVLRQVTVPVIPDDVCAKPGWYYHDFIPLKTFCAGYEEGGRDACAGDSGGPLISKFDGHWYVTGIASWGYSCAEARWPGIYTNVTYYLPWIHKQMAARGFDVPCQPLIG
ncbi:trypsin-1-like [Littorina saxatilis]|uniref:Peptidase S1 domain-containing protein n=1 Tax=Littorina saxatilis TaxID=31220 RepID=A0AAN9BUJ0_9CAEN